MTFRALQSCAIAVLVAAGAFGAEAMAEDLSVSAAPPVPSKLDQQINQAVGSAGSTSSSDVDARVRDLEATRTAIDQKKPPTVSLSVSGWVDQQVQYNVKQ